MGLLDDLRRQADMARTHDSLQRSNLQENVRVVDEAMHKTFLYLLDLFKQLEVLKPANPTAYVIQGVGELRNLHYVSAFVDPRKKKFAERDVYDYMDFYVKWAAPASLVVERDMPQTIKKVKDTLWAVNIKCTEVETRSSYGSISKVQFTIPAALTVNFTLKADIEGRRLLFYGKNALRLGVDDFAAGSRARAAQALGPSAPQGRSAAPASCNEPAEMRVHPRRIGVETGEQLEAAHGLADVHVASVRSGTADAPGRREQRRLERHIDDLGNPHPGAQQLFG